MSSPLCSILAGADLQGIRAACPFPDWLGYLGLALHYSEDAERIGRVVTLGWTPQLLEILPRRSSASNLLSGLLEEPDGILTWRMLESVEARLLSSA